MTEIPVSMTEAAARALLPFATTNVPWDDQPGRVHGFFLDQANAALVAAGVPALLTALAEAQSDVPLAAILRRAVLDAAGYVRDAGEQLELDVIVDDLTDEERAALAPLLSARASGFLEGDT